MRPGFMQSSFGGSVVALRVLDAVAADIDHLVVGRVLGLDAFGRYAIAYRLPELVLLNVLGLLQRRVPDPCRRARATGAPAS